MLTAKVQLSVSLETLKRTNKVYPSYGNVESATARVTSGSGFRVFTQKSYSIQALDILHEQVTLTAEDAVDVNDNFTITLKDFNQYWSDKRTNYVPEPEPVEEQLDPGPIEEPVEEEQTVAQEEEKN